MATRGRDRTRKVSPVDSIEWTAWINPVFCLGSLLCVLDSLCSADFPLVACFQGSGEPPANRVWSRLLSFFATYVQLDGLLFHALVFFRG